MLRLATLTLALLPAIVLAADAPLLTNGSFEQADDHGAAAGWTQDTAGLTTLGFARDTEVKHGGAASARLTAPAPLPRQAWPAFASNLKVEAGQCYKIEAWLKSRDVTGQAYVAADYLDAAGQRVTFSASSSLAGTTDWKAISLPAHIPTGAVTMSVRLILFGSGTAWFDDVVVTRDAAAERSMARLREPLPAEMVTRGTTSTGDLTRLHRLFAAATQGGHYTFGIIGGSITAGAAASSMDAHYSGYVVRWLKEHFPKAEWTFVNAGIGATGTDYGCLRAQRDLLAKKPDLVVTEYAVNDGNTQAAAETYEGLLRQILTSPQQPPVLMLFMMSRNGGNAQEWQSKLGRHYGLPMLSYRDEVWPEIEAKRMAWTDVSPDEVHPNDIGHGYAGKLLTALLDQALASLPAAAPAPAPALPAPLLTDVYQFARLVEAEDLKPVSTTGWSYDGGNVWNKAWKATVPGSVVEFEVTGEQLFLSFWRIRGPMGRAKITIDGGHESVQEAWFDQTWGGYRCMVKLPTGAPGKHRVKLELLAEKSPESTGTEFRLLCLGTAGQ